MKNFRLSPISYLTTIILSMDSETFANMDKRERLMYNKQTYSMFVSAFMGGLMGMHVTHAYGISLKYGFIIGSSVIFYIDYNLVTNFHSKRKALGRILRVVMGLVISILGSLSSLTLLFQNEIKNVYDQSSNIEIKRINDNYESDKKKRFNSLYILKAQQEEAHKLCHQEELNNGQGREYRRLHATCESLFPQIKNLSKELEISEKPYYEDYLREKEAHLKKNGVFKDYGTLFNLIKGNPYYFITSLFIFMLLFYLDMQLIIQKSENDDEDDPYSNADGERKLRQKVLKDIDTQVKNTETLGFKMIGALQTLMGVQNLYDQVKAYLESSDKKIPLLEHTLNHGEEAIQQLRKHLALTLGEMSNEVNDKDLKDEIEIGFVDFEDKKNHSDSSMQNLKSFYSMSTPMKDFCNKIWEECSGSLQQKQEVYAKKVFDWMNKNINYNFSLERYASPLYVFNFKMGCCGETATLYNLFMRYKGVNANFAHVKIDCHGQNVDHACSRITFNNGKNILVDAVAYKIFDIKHKKIELWSDEEVLNHYRTWNKS